MKRLKKLDPIHKAAARMRVEGKSADDIAVELNIAKRTVYTWMSDDLMRAEINELLSKVTEVFAERMANASLVALDETVKTIQMPLDDTTLTPEQKLAFISELLDRTGHLNKHNPQPLNGAAGANVNIYQQMGQLSDAELIQRARELSGGKPVIDGDPPDSTA